MKRTITSYLIVFCIVGLLLGCSENSANIDNNPEQNVAQENQVQSTTASAQEVVNEPESYSDESFLSDLGKGLMKRWDISDSRQSFFGTEQFKTDFLELINIELDHIESYKDAVYKNNELQSLAVSYIKILEDQISLLDDYPNNDFLIKWDEATEGRKAVLKQLLENYPVPIDEKYSDIVAEFTNPEKAEEKKEKQSEPDLLVVGSKVSSSDEYITLGVIIKNNTSINICTPTINVSLLDSDGDIIDAIQLQAMVTVFPGQCITLSTFTERGDAESFTVDTKGWVEALNDQYEAKIGGHLDPISLDTEKEEFEEIGKSSVNCIDQDVDNHINGNDIGISIEDMYIEEGWEDHVECFAKVKNNTDSIISTPTLHAALMDEEGNIIAWDMMQEMVSVNPGQSITLSCYTEAPGTEYFTVSYAAYDVEDDYKSGYLTVIPKAAER